MLDGAQLLCATNQPLRTTGLQPLPHHAVLRLKHGLSHVGA